MRKLASIQTVTKIEAIEGADSVERARILGWSVVVKKGEFNIQDRVVFCEVDSLLPEVPRYEFLRKGCYRGAIVNEATGEVIQRAGFRVRTIRLRGQISQGLCLPLDVLPEGVSQEEGADVTEALGIIKYEPASMSYCGGIKGPFPSFLSKTDETRVQVLESVLARHRGKTFNITEKVDGTSFSVFVHGEEFGVCSRNYQVDDADMSNALCALVNALGLEGKLREVAKTRGHSIAVQGELLGPGIQKNRYGFAEPTMMIFNVIDLGTGNLLDYGAGQEVLAQLGLRSVPQLGQFVLNHSIDQLVKMSEGASIVNPKIPREGIVLRPLIDESDLELGRLSFKVINPSYLLKFEE
jgi:RNA ligase (TIGR02306 family)